MYLPLQNIQIFICSQFNPNLRGEREFFSRSFLYRKQNITLNEFAVVAGTYLLCLCVCNCNFIPRDKRKFLNFYILTFKKKKKTFRIFRGTWLFRTKKSQFNCYLDLLKRYKQQKRTCSSRSFVWLLCENK